MNELLAIVWKGIFPSDLDMEWKNVNGIWFKVEGIGITFWPKNMMWAIFDVILLGISGWTQLTKK